MNNRKAREIRKALNLPRLPKEMNVGERRFYRTMKHRFDRMPAPVRLRFLDNINSIAQST